MKHTLPFIALLLSSLFFLTACEKDEIAPSDRMYLPLQAGNQWLYVATDDENKTEEYSLRVVGDTLIQGRTYASAINTLSDPDRVVYLFSSEDEVRGIDFFSDKTGISTIPGAKVVNPGTDWLLLRAADPVGASWTNVVEVESRNGGSSVRYRINYKFTIEGKDLRKEVRAANYEAVTKVRLDISFTVSGQTTTVGTEYHYWAPRYGLILQEGERYRTELINFRD